MPIDPVSEGTWIGASDAPVPLVLMNVYIAQVGESANLLDEHARQPVSRGTIIPRVLAAGSLAACSHWPPSSK